MLVNLKGQVGTVNFANGAALLDAPVTFATTEKGLEGPDWGAELLLQLGSNLVHVAGPVSFETNTLAGYFFAGSVPVLGTKPGEVASFRIRLTNSITLFSIDSQAITVTLGGDKSPPANLVGLPAFEVPPVIRLAIDRAGERVLLSWPKSASNMLLQFAHNLPGSWQNVSETPIANDLSISVLVEIKTQQQFFRLISF
jgi:hypothetical protein